MHVVSTSHTFDLARLTLMPFKGEGSIYALIMTTVSDCKVAGRLLKPILGHIRVSANFLSCNGSIYGWPWMDACKASNRDHAATVT